MEIPPQFAHGDGTSQAGRIRQALHPESIPVDERSMHDLLVFANKYSHELKYFNDQNEEDGDWSDFLRDHELGEIAAFISGPGRFLEDAEKRDRFTRPHLILFVTFLKLLQHARAQLNDLTRKHLEFYYHTALRLTSRQGIPDRLHALVELVDGQDQFLVPAGTLFQAGQDSQGNDLFYRSDEDLVANQATVASLKSLFVEKKIVGIHEARQDPDVLIEFFPENKDVLEEGEKRDRSFMAMLMMALGTPGPGRKLAPYPDGITVNANLLKDLEVLLEFIRSELYMSIGTFRTLMQLKSDLTLVENQEKPINRQWEQINEILETLGKRRSQNPDFKLDPSTPPDDFERNLLFALDLSEVEFEDFFNELPDVDNIYDLYRRRDQEEEKKFIQNSLYLKVEEFAEMMGLVEEINARWRQIYEILRAAARKKYKDDPNHEFPAPEIRKYASEKFDTLIQKTLGTIDYPELQVLQVASFYDCHEEIIKLENFFHIPAEQFVFILKINATPEKDVQSWEWEQVYVILEEAHAEKTLADRRKALKEKRETSGFDAMIRFAIGDPNPGNPLPDSRNFLELDAETDKQYIQEKLFLAPENFSYVKNNHSLSLNDPKWENVYVILEQAQRRKRKLAASLAQVERWENVYVAEDASQIQVRLDAEGESTTPRWRTFGKGYSSPATESHTSPGDIGFAVGSPLLALADGMRVITLTLGFQEEGFDKIKIEDAIKAGAPSPFRFLLSSEKDLLAIETVTVKLIDTALVLPGAEEPYQRGLQFTITLNEQIPPIAPLTVGSGIQTPWPVLQIMLADIQSDGRPVKRYSAFQALKLEKIHLQVKVDGIANLTLQNDDGLLNPKKPFEPFGLSPVVRSSFYIAHPELCSKKLDELRLNIDWFGVPDNLSDHYLGYAPYPTPTSQPASPIADNTVFKAKLRLHDNRSSFDVKEIQLFHADSPNTKTGATGTSEIKASQADILSKYKNYGRDLQSVTAPETLEWRRYWEVELDERDFLHAAYPQAAAESAKRVKFESGTSGPTKPDPYIVKPPYTPKIKKLSAGYTASLELKLTSRLEAQADQLYHVEPFGHHDLTDETNPFFLPQYEHEGELFIGIQALAPPQNLSLLFQLADGSADPDVEREQIHWTYLSGDQWYSLEQGKLLGDTTNGLLNSGIIKFDLSPVEPSTLLPADLYWIRATIAKNSLGVADTVGIHAQAVSATFEDRGNAADHLSQPLPAGSVRGLAEIQPEVKAVHQLYSSYGGKSPEVADAFYRRVSERLRHKDRALTCWDYEHLTLEAFPGIYKVKCLPVGSSDDPQLSDVIQVVVIPDIRGKLPFDPFEPKAPADLLWQIEKYLIQHSPPDAQLKVKNPSYVRVRVRLNVRFREGFNPGYYTDALNRELQKFLSPWAYDQSADIFFGGSIKSSLIVNFVEERPYIDYVHGIQIFTSLDGKSFTPYIEPDSAGSETLFAPDAILVSDRSHVIGPIPEEGFEDEFFTGINYMMIEFDFRVAEV